MLELDYPDYYNSTSMLLSMIVWFITPLALAFWRFEKRDI
jgi:ABC-type transport system involved in multi-copper enzyme maturation permease subunit